MHTQTHSSSIKHEDNNQQSCCSAATAAKTTCACAACEETSDSVVAAAASEIAVATSPASSTYEDQASTTSDDTEGVDLSHDTACRECRRVHKKCDHKRPCSRCVQQGLEHMCVSVPKKKRGRPRKLDVGVTSNISAVRAAISQQQAEGRDESGKKRRSTRNKTSPHAASLYERDDSDHISKKHHTASSKKGSSPKTSGMSTKKIKVGSPCAEPSVSTQLGSFAPQPVSLLPPGTSQPSSTMHQSMMVSQPTAGMHAIQSIPMPTTAYAGGPAAAPQAPSYMYYIPPPSASANGTAYPSYHQHQYAGYTGYAPTANYGPQAVPSQPRTALPSIQQLLSPQPQPQQQAYQPQSYLSTSYQQQQYAAYAPSMSAAAFPSMSAMQMASSHTTPFVTQSHQAYPPVALL